VPTISAFHAPATGREGRRNAPLAGIARSGLGCVAHDLGLGGIHVVLVGKPDIATRRIGGRLVVVAARAAASRLFALARLQRRLEIGEQFPRTTVQEVSV
jgi:hypothetical protein